MTTEADENVGDPRPQSVESEDPLRSARYQASRKGQKQMPRPMGIANQLQNMSNVMGNRMPGAVGK